MHILYFYQYFSTPKGGWGTRVYDFSKDWINNGHRVTVVTSVYAKSDLKGKGLVTTRNIDQINVKVINIRIDNRQSIIKRIFSFMVYMIISLWFAMSIKADIVVASSGPITVGIPGLLAKSLGRKFIFEVRDLWPDGAIAMGILKNKYLQKLAYALEKKCYLRADYIIGLSPGIKDNIKHRFELNNIISIPNGVNLELFNTQMSELELPGKIQEKNIAIYTGNIGQVNNSDLLLKTAIALKNREITNIVILMIGEGQTKDEILYIKNEQGIDTLEILDLMPKIDLINFLKNSMVSLVPLKGLPVLDTSSPNKLFESLAAGLPVIQTTNGWIKELLDRTGCGYTVPPDNPETLADLLITLSNKTRKERINTSKKCTELAKSEFNKSKLSDKMLNIFHEVINN